jgi:hypothetical protein
MTLSVHDFKPKPDAQPIPRPLDPLQDVGLGGEKRAGDLRGAETAERLEARATRDSTGAASWQQTKSRSQESGVRHQESE